MVRRGVLLDVPAPLGRRAGSSPATRSPSTTSRPTVERQGTAVGAGDVVLVRSGWGQHFDDGDGDTFIAALSTGVPGVGEAGATWLADHGVHAVGADTIAFERLAPGRRPRPAAGAPGAAGRARHLHHRDDGLEELAADGVHEFLFVLSPLPFFGATGSPVRPLAVVGAMS